MYCTARFHSFDFCIYVLILDKELLEKYSEYVSVEINKWINEGKTPKEEFRPLKALESFDISP